ncbi:hypothetical protein AcV7_004699 [Taiwanofungus camphoratus]|nr:hypothetical protein AcV7_004699 [Antrodia cinnamomea]
MNEWPVDILRKDLIAHGGTTSGQRSGSIKAIWAHLCAIRLATLEIVNLALTVNVSCCPVSGFISFRLRK